MPRNIVSGMLREGLYTRIVGRRVLYFQSLTSTMDEATRQAEDDAMDGTVILAEQQTAGRGRFQKSWVSPAGNLYLSIVVRPSIQALPYLSIISGVAAARAIRKTTGIRPTIKWPNDVRIGGKKVCGILVENSIEGDSVRYSIVGFGVNVSFDPSTIPELANTATNLNVEAGVEVERQVLLRHLLQEMDSLYLPLRGGGTTPPPKVGTLTAERNSLERARDEWRSLLETLGMQVEVRWQEEVYRGYAEDVDEFGNLVLRQGDGTLATLPAGEVTTVVPRAQPLEEKNEGLGC